MKSSNQIYKFKDKNSKMGNTNPFHTLHTGKTSCYNFDYGCDHHSDSVKIIDFKYKTVPLTDEETKILYKRLMKLTGNSTIEATFGIKSDDYDGTQEIVQVRSDILYHLTMF